MSKYLNRVKSSALVILSTISKIVRVKDMSGAQKSIKKALWDADMIQNETAIQVG